MLFLQIIDF